MPKTTLYMNSDIFLYDKKKQKRGFLKKKNNLFNSILNRLLSCVTYDVCDPKLLEVFLA